MVGLVGDLLKNFVIGIAVSVDTASQARAKAALREIDKEAERAAKSEISRGKELERERRRTADEAERDLKKISTSYANHLHGTLNSVARQIGLVATAVAGIRVVEGVITDLKNLGRVAADIGSSSGQLKAFSEAFEEVTKRPASEAIAGIEAFADHIKANSGFLRVLQQQGVTETKNTFLQLQQLTKYFRDQVAQHGYDRTRALAEMEGINKEILNFLLNPATEAAINKRIELQTKWGVDFDKLAKQTGDLAIQTGQIATQLGLAQVKIISAVANSLTPFASKLNKFLSDNAVQIAGAIDRLSEAVGGWVNQKGDELTAWLKEIIDPANEVGQQKWTKFFDDLQISARNVGTLVSEINAFIASIPVDSFKDIFSGANDVLANTKRELQAIRDIYNDLMRDIGLARETAGKAASTVGPAAAGIEGAQPLGPTMSGRDWTPIPEEGKTGQPAKRRWLPFPERLPASPSSAPSQDDPERKIHDAAISQKESVDKFAKAVDEDKKNREDQPGLLSRMWAGLRNAFTGGGGGGAGDSGFIGGGVGSGGGGGGGGAPGGGKYGGVTGNVRPGGGEAPNAPPELAKGAGASILDAISKAEGTTKGYNDSYSHQVKQDLTSKTLDEIDQIQAGMKGSSAIGRYQFMRNTLKGLKSELGLKGDEKFTPELQDRLGRRLLQRRGYDDWKAGKITSEQFMGRLAQEWAGVTDASGKSVYAGVGANKQTASTVNMMNAALNKDKAGYTGQVANTEGAMKDAAAGGSPHRDPTPIDPAQVARNRSGMEAVRDLLQAGGIETTSDYRDPEHPLSRANRTSLHTRGRAIDLRAKTPEEGAANLARAKETLAAQGFREGEHYNVLDETGAKRSGHATGPHLHLSLTPAGIAKGRGEGAAARDPDRMVRDTIKANAERFTPEPILRPGEKGYKGVAPLSSGPIANDNSSRNVTQTNQFNTTIQSSDPAAANSAYKRSNEQLAGMATGQLKSAVR